MRWIILPMVVVVVVVPLLILFGKTKEGPIVWEGQKIIETKLLLGESITYSHVNFVTDCSKDMVYAVTEFLGDVLTCTISGDVNSECTGYFYIRETSGEVRLARSLPNTGAVSFNYKLVVPVEEPVEPVEEPVEEPEPTDREPDQGNEEMSPENQQPAEVSDEGQAEEQPAQEEIALLDVTDVESEADVKHQKESVEQTEQYKLVVPVEEPVEPVEEPVEEPEPTDREPDQGNEEMSPENQQPAEVSDEGQAEEQPAQEEIALLDVTDVESEADVKHQKESVEQTEQISTLSYTLVFPSALIAGAIFIAFTIRRISHSNRPDAAPYNAAPYRDQLQDFHDEIDQIFEAARKRVPRATCDFGRNQVRNRPVVDQPRQRRRTPPPPSLTRRPLHYYDKI